MCAHDPRPQDFTRYRHRWEMPLIWLCALITIAAVILGLGIFSVDEGTMLNDALGEEDANLLRGISETAFLILFAPILVYLRRFYLAAQSRANGILVGEGQFPELFAMYQEIGRRLEMPKLPRPGFAPRRPCPATRSWSIATRPCTRSSAAASRHRAKCSESPQSLSSSTSASTMAAIPGRTISPGRPPVSSASSRITQTGVR